LELARAVLRTCARDKHCTGHHLWIFTLLARAASSGQSIQILAGDGRVWDCLLLMRAVHDAVLDLEYLIESPLNGDHLSDLFSIECAEDAYEELKFAAELDKKTLEECAQDSPYARRVLRNWQKAKRHRAFRADKRSKMKRWRLISIDEKYKSITGHTREYLSKFVGSKFGNAFAHSRPLALKHFFRVGADGEPSFQTGRAKHPVYNPRFCCKLTAALIAHGCKDIIKAYCLSESLQKRVVRLGEEIGLGMFADDFT
jgi:hypothetical protein